MAILKIFESAALALTSDQIDMANGVVRDVVILTEKSKNGRRYSDKAQTRLVEMLNSNPRAYINHALDKTTGKRIVPGLFDLGGRWENVNRDEKTKKVKGNLRVLGNPEEKSRLMARISEASDLIGISIVADGEVTPKNKAGEEIVEDLSRVYSADLVSEPAATTHLFESAPPDGGDKHNQGETKKMDLKELQAQAPDLVESIRQDAIKPLIAECDSLKAEVAKMKAEKESAEKEKKIRATLAESGLDPEQHIKFTVMLAEADLKAYIETWKTTASGKPQVKIRETATGGEKIDHVKALEALYGGV